MKILFLVPIAAKLEKLEEKQDTIIQMLRAALVRSGHDDDEDEADIFPGAMTTIDEMNDFEKRLNDKTYRKKW